MLFCRRIGTAAFRVNRMPLLEELLEPVVLKTMDHDTMTEMKNYVPPTLEHQMEASLSSEFNRHIVKTDWNEYTDPLKEQQHEQAARLLHYTLVSLKRSTKKYPQSIPPENIGLDNETWLKQECDQLLKEIANGDTSRWEGARQLVGARWERMSEGQKKAIGPATILVGKNPYMHPVIKRRVIDEICAVILKTVP